jgi:ABC-type Zn2+ transport system substrate-binding protein/surface adhesin
MSEFNQDSTSLPMIVNLHNPFHDPHKYSYDSIECINCGEKNCKNCPIPVTLHKTLEEFMSQIVHPKKFQGNVHLFKELEQIKQLHEKQDDEEDEEDKKENNADVEMESAAPKNYKTSL